MALLMNLSFGAGLLLVILVILLIILLAKVPKRKSDNNDVRKDVKSDLREIKDQISGK